MNIYARVAATLAIGITIGAGTVACSGTSHQPSAVQTQTHSLVEGALESLPPQHVDHVQQLVQEDALRIDVEQAGSYIDRAVLHDLTSHEMDFDLPY